MPLFSLMFPRSIHKWSLTFFLKSSKPSFGGADDSILIFMKSFTYPLNNVSDVSSKCHTSNISRIRYPFRSANEISLEHHVLVNARSSLVCSHFPWCCVTAHDRHNGKNNLSAFPHRRRTGSTGWYRTRDGTEPGMVQNPGCFYFTLNEPEPFRVISSRVMNFYRMSVGCS